MNRDLQASDNGLCKLTFYLMLFMRYIIDNCVESLTSPTSRIQAATLYTVLEQNESLLECMNALKLKFVSPESTQQHMHTRLVP